jgi:hypothetical protein
MQVSLAKLFFLRKGLCLDAEGTRNRKSSKGKNKKYKKGWGGLFFYSPFFIIYWLTIFIFSIEQRGKEYGRNNCKSNL